MRDRRARVCVATDVAARGIDLPTLSLVVHVELPRDAETLQHRSGRTGRAGKKGTAVLIVPFPRRKRVEMMLRGARIDFAWMPVPTPEDIRTKDRERMLEAMLAEVEIDDEDRALAAELMAKKSPEDIAAALVHAHRASMPQPEELLAASPNPNLAPDKQHHRPGFDDTVWFVMNVGRRQNADPRWLLPLICRRGGITKNEVGAIRIQANETGFQIPRAIASRFAAAVIKSAGQDGEDDSGIRIQPVDGPQQPAAPARAHASPRRADRQRPAPARPAPPGPAAGTPQADPRAPQGRRFAGKGAPRRP